MSQFRSSTLAVKWSELHKQRQELIEGKKTSKIEDKIDLISSLMSSCKTGFMLPEAKIKKTIKELISSFKSIQIKMESSFVKVCFVILAISIKGKNC